MSRASVQDSFQDINEFFKRQGARYGRQLEKPVVIQVARPLTVLPPALPTESSGLNVALWSLKMRWWSWRHGRQDDLVGDDIRMYILYQKRSSEGPLERSVGIRNGSYGLVNAVATREMAARNRIIITHELLHILGAIDKYDLFTGQPIAPDGLADPDQSPLYPQVCRDHGWAHCGFSQPTGVTQPALTSCVIGAVTASEIGW